MNKIFFNVTRDVPSLKSYKVLEIHKKFLDINPVISVIEHEFFGKHFQSFRQ